MLCSALIVFLFPSGLLIYLYRSEKISLKAAGVGALVFVVFQFLIRIPLLASLSVHPQFQQMKENLFFSAVLIGGLSAGLFEEVGRYLGFRFLLNKKLSWKNGVAYGLGHGGIEAIGLVGLTYIGNIVLSLMINTGTFDQLVGTQLDPAAATMFKNQLVNTPSYYFLIGGLERFFSFVIQIGLSLVVLYGVVNRKLRYLLYAILLHALVNAPAVIMTQLGVNIWLVELYILFLAILAFAWIMRARSLFAPSPSGAAAGIHSEEENR
jgi:uncharacterized membrane protein YhfC